MINDKLQYNNVYIGITNENPWKTGLIRKSQTVNWYIHTCFNGNQGKWVKVKGKLVYYYLYQWKKEGMSA